jgi:hypothetical protein
MTFMDGLLATMDGRLEEAVEMGRHILARGEQLGLAPMANSLHNLVSFMPLLHLGRLGQSAQLSKPTPLSAHPIFRVITGEDAEVAAILEEWIVSRPGVGSADDETQPFVDILLLQGAIRIGHRRVAELILRRFDDCGMRTTGTLFMTCIPRHLGAAAALLDRSDEARRYYDEAMRVTIEMRFRPELALTRLQLAELLLEHYPEEKADALEHLDFAIKEFREMKMQPSLERALKLRP